VAEVEKVKVIVGWSDNTISKSVVTVRKDGKVINAIARYGTAMREAYGDSVVGITNCRGYLWVGHNIDTSACPALANWSHATQSDKDGVTWDTL
jgi:hypothetical protein